jgi:DNA-directed RNA polymerase specialized sigma24 family protein
VHGAERWDSDRSTLSTYVTWHIRRAIQLEQDRAAGSGYRRTVAAGELWVRPLSLDAAGGLPAEQAEDTAPRPVLAAMMAAPDDTEAEALDAALLDGALAAGAAACRDDLDRAVLRVLVGELRRTDVAEQFGVSKQTVTNRVAHLVERMRASLRVYASAA